MAAPRYADVERVMWRTLLRPLAPNAKLVYMALRTGPDGTSLPGLVETDAARLVSDTGLSFAQVTEALGQLTVERLVEVDDRYCLVRDFGATPAPKSQTSNKTIIGWWRVFEQLPPSPLLAPFVAVLHGACDFGSEGVAEAWARTFGAAAKAEAPSDAPSNGASDAPPDAPFGTPSEGSSDAPLHPPSEGPCEAPSDAPSASRGRAGACAPARDSEQRAAVSEQQKPDEQENAQAREAEHVRLTCDTKPLQQALYLVCKSAPHARLVHAVASVGENAAGADKSIDATVYAIKFVDTYGQWRRRFPHQPAWSPEAISQHATSVQRVMAGEDPMPEPGGRAPPGDHKANLRKGRAPVSDWSDPS